MSLVWRHRATNALTRRDPALMQGASYRRLSARVNDRMSAEFRAVMPLTAPLDTGGYTVHAW